MSAIDPEDLMPRPAKPAPRLLDPMSVEELESYIAEMEVEIARVRAAIEAKRGHRGVAEALFRR
ncbi:uncharacterized small protein (DUF1192 family) [Stella humosa]|uniref:Uncharacterized small protein (DUF1192 family) n=1 Tax=Stella humosa TaxID=94 RepID=A0A3N1LIZ1_9PROT|nr:DUF1192 domain-containing protein [Stella humosa]ROP91270.1 uncharacterized small protein (DUF1192 family) [Stella humosa]BBK34376.1 hypothetical protein STHU_50100 [Stella humosa]